MASICGRGSRRRLADVGSSGGVTGLRSEDDWDAFGMEVFVVWTEVREGFGCACVRSELLGRELESARNARGKHVMGGMQWTDRIGYGGEDGRRQNGGGIRTEGMETKSHQLVRSRRKRRLAGNVDGTRA